ncbi:MAG: DUF4157 domain-containing protein [Myxococcales bacterium]|nr:DUF4157 domain-containing protein [Myxococcales bacterium]
MFDAEKLNRDDLQDKEGKKQVPDLDGPAPASAPAADMPSLGQSAPSLGGGVGDAVAAQEEASKADQQAELARLSSLPAGHADLESAKKGDALDASVPAGDGPSGGAAKEAQSAPPEQQSQPDGDIGPSPGAPTSDALPGASVSIPNIDPKSTIEGASGAAQAAAIGNTTLSPESAPSEAPKEIAAVPSGAEATVEAADTSVPDTPQEAPTPVSETLDTASVESASIDAPTVAQESAVDTSAPEQEVLSDPEPIVVPDVTPNEAAAEGIAAVPQGAVPDVAGGNIDQVAAAPEVQVEDASLDAAPEADVSIAQGAAPISADASVVTEVAAAPVDTSAAVIPTVAEVAASPAPADSSLAAASSAPAPVAPTASVAAASDASVEEGSVGAVEGAVGPSQISEGGAGTVAKAAEAPAAVAEVAATPSLTDETAVDTAKAGASEAVDAVVETVAGAVPSAPAGSGALSELTPDTADAGVQADAADVKSGREAAQLEGEEIFGKNSDNAAELALTPPGGSPAEQVSAADQAGVGATIDVVAELGDGGAKAAVKDMAAKGTEAESQAAQTGRLVDSLDEGVGELKKKAGEIQALQKDPVQNAMALLADDDAERLTGSIRGKAEKGLGVNLDSVKVYRGEGAEKVANAVGASAFAQGKSIVMGDADKFVASKREKVLYEEIAHVVQMDKGGGGGRAGLSQAADKSEKQAKSAAELIQKGAEVQGLEADNERRAVYRNEGSEESAPMFPDRVTVSLAGRTVTINLPSAPVESSKLVNLPSMDVPGLELSPNATLFFDTETGEFKSGKTTGTVKVGSTLTTEARDITIAKSGNMTATFNDAKLKVGDLIDATLDATVGKAGISATGQLGVSDLKGEKLSQWLKGGRLGVTVDNTGAISGSGSLDFEIAPFMPGKLAASIKDEKLGGTITIDQTADLALGPAATAAKGKLTGTLSESSKVQISGGLGLTVTPLPNGFGGLSLTWDSETAKVGGSASFMFHGENRLEPVVFTHAFLSGTVEDGQLKRMDGSGGAVYDNLFSGNWAGGGIDLLDSKVDFTLSGGLKEPLDRSPVKVSGGALTIQIEKSNLVSTSGEVDFELADFMKGKAVLEKGTNKETINATATAELVTPKTFDELTLSKGAATVQVRGTSVKIVGGNVDMNFRDGTAVGKLDLAASDQWEKLTGSGKANLKVGETWGELKGTGGAVDIDVEANRLKSAQGNMKFESGENYAGTLAFDARDNFAVLNGTATTWLRQGLNIGADLNLVADPEKKFSGKVEASRVTQIKGPLAWEHSKFKGTVNVNTWTPQLNQISGTGPADAKARFRIGESNGSQLYGNTGSKLTGHIEAGLFQGISGTLNWQYHQWLAGTAQIADPVQAVSFEQLTGNLKAQLIAPKRLSSGSDITLLPGKEGALTVTLQDGKPHQYSGTVDFRFKDFAEGQAVIAGEKLDFDKLEGDSVLKVVKDHNMSGQSGASLTEGGALKVTVANSTIETFTGKTNIKYAGWLEGTVDAKAGSSFRDGVTGRVKGPLTGTPAEQTGDLKMAKGGTGVVDFVTGNQPTDFEVGSEVNWDFGSEKWLAGTMKITQKTNFASISGPSSATVLSDKLLPNGSPSVTLLPSEGLTVTWANNTLMNYQGSAEAKVDDWVQGRLSIDGIAVGDTFSGQLIGKLVGEKQEGNLKLMPGGKVSVDVQANNPRFIKGDIPFNYSSNLIGLGGVVKATESQHLQAINGSVKGAQVIEEKATGGGFNIKKGGKVDTTMTASLISNIGGQVNFEWGDKGTPWIEGALGIEGQANPFSMAGDFTGKISAETAVGTGLKLMPGAGLAGKVENNRVSGIRGDIAFELSDWLEGLIEISADTTPNKLTGKGLGTVLPGKKHHVQGNVYLIPGAGAFDVEMTDSAVTKISGEVPWHLEDGPNGTWLTGVAKVANGSVDSIIGEGPGAIIGNGRTYSEGAPKQVKIHPGAGLTKVAIDANGTPTYTGAVQAEFGLDNGEVLHVGRGGHADGVKGSSFKGTVKGGLMTPLAVEPKLQLKSGGDITVSINESATPFSGTFNFGWGGDNKNYLAGQVEVTNQPSPGTLKGNITTASINEEQTRGKLTIKKGGDVHGELVNPNDVKLKGGTFNYGYSDWLDGTISIHGDLNFSDAEGGFNGAGIGQLTRDLEMSGGLRMLTGSTLEGEYLASELASAKGTVGIKRDEELVGSVIIEQSDGDPPVITGAAQLVVAEDMDLGGDLTIVNGSMVSGYIVSNEVADMDGTLLFKYGAIEGSLSGSWDMRSNVIDGLGMATLVEPRPVPGSTLVLEPGGSLEATVNQNQMTDVRGLVNWSYGDLGWLKGTISAESGNLDDISGKATGSIAIEKFLDEKLRLKKGGGFTADFDGTGLTGFTGTIGVVYDGWIDGAATIASGDLTKLEGEVSATTMVRKDLKGGAFLKPGASMKANFVNSSLESFSGGFGWQMEEWLEGRLDVSAGSTLDSIAGEGGATLRERKRVGEKLELERGGNLKARFEGSDFKGVGGKVGWIYDTWLGGAIEIAPFSHLDSVDGKASTNVRHSHVVAGDLQLKQGGALEATLAGGDVKQIQGQASWRYGEWLGGSVELAPSELTALKGSAEATLLQHKELNSDFSLKPGGSIFIDFDTTKDLAQQTFMGDVAWMYQDWLDGTVTVGAGGSFKGVDGLATARLVADKEVGNGLVLKTGGNLEVELGSNKPLTFGGDVLWQYEDWIAGQISVAKGSKLTAITGEATAHLRRAKEVGDGKFKLLSGGSPTVKFTNSGISGIHGHMNFGYENWLEGGVNIEQGSSLTKISGEGGANVINDKPVGDGKFRIRTGSSASLKIANNGFDGLTGQVKFGYEDWVEGAISVEASKLESIEGDANVQIVGDKQIGGDLTLKPGGAANISIAGGAITEWGGSVRVQYQDWLEGNLNIETKGSLDSLTGEISGTLLQTKEMGDFKVLQGAQLKAGFTTSGVDTISGIARFEYQDWLMGAVTIDPSSTITSISGDVQAQLVKEHAPGGGQFKLSKGGSLKAQFKDSGFDNLSGQANWKYEGDKAKVGGSIRLEPSNLKSITGEAKAHLTAPLDAGNNIKMLKGGELNLRVENSKPGSFGGRVNWQYDNWLQGSVKVATGTGFDGPYSGEAQAKVIKAKPVGDKAKLLNGGHMKMAFDSAAGLENSTFDGRVGLQYENWLKGHVTSRGSTFTSLTGDAKLQLLAGKDIGDSGIKILKGSTANFKMASNELTGFDGMVRWRFEDWLEGTLSAVPGSNMDSVTGQAHGRIRKKKDYDNFSLKQGSGVTLHVDQSSLSKFSGTVLWESNNWISGSMALDSRTTKDKFYGQGSASTQAPKDLGNGIMLKQGSAALVMVEASDIKKIGGSLLVDYEDWATGSIGVDAPGDLDKINGQGNLRLLNEKDVGKVTLKKDSFLTATVDNSDVNRWSGTVAFSYDDYIEGQLDLDGGSDLDAVKGFATVGLINDVQVANSALVIKEGGRVSGTFDSEEGIQSVQGQLALEYDGWLRGMGVLAGANTLDTFEGSATVQVIERKEFNGGIALEKDSALIVDFAGGAPVKFSGNIDVTFQEWLKGSVSFTATDLNDISGVGSLRVEDDKKLGGPLNLLQGSYVTANIANSDLKDFGGLVKLEVEEWGSGQLSIREGSTLDSITGEGLVKLDQPKEMGDVLTLTKGSIGARVEASELKGIYGEVEAELDGMGKGWVRVHKSSTLDSFDGQAGLALTEPQKIGEFAELSGGEVLANFEANELKSFGGFAEINIFGWGKGRVEVDPGSTMELISGVATVTLEGPKEMANGKLLITHGEASARVKDSELTELGGKIGVELVDVARGEVSGTLNVQKEEFSGQGKVEQIKEWGVGPATIRNGKLEANVVANELRSAAGSADIDAGKFGKGSIEVNFIRKGEEDIIYGKAQLEFQPHDRMTGILKAELTEDKKMIGEGTVKIKISDDPVVTGEASVILREDEHVVLKGAVNVPGPFELFKMDPYKKDITLLDAGFLVYTPPMVEVNAGAGLGMECGLKPLTIANIVLSGECDLMEPSFAEMSIAADLSSSAYADLNAWVEGSVSVSAAVVKVEAGLRAALNLHLEAAINARPTITANRNGLSFDMPVSAELSAALRLILTFFAKVRVGIDVGLFSIMKTVWRYECSPDPLELASMSIGAKGHVHAGADGFSGTMEPEYEPPDMSIEGLKKSLGL